MWQFTDEIRKKHSQKTYQTWKEGLNLPGVTQVGYLKKLMTSFPMNEIQPDQSFITGGHGDCAAYAPVIRGKSFALIYIPTGNQTTVRFGILTGRQIKASWFDPRTGEKTLIGTFNNSGEKSFHVPGMSKELTWLRSGRGCDWVLVLEGTN